MRIVFRADGSNNTGIGHIFRLIALAGILKDDFECVFVTTNADEFILRQIRSVCSAIILLPPKKEYDVPDSDKIEETEFDLEEHLNGNEIVVLDGYWFGPKYQENVRKAGSKIVSVDDLASSAFSSDIVINHAPAIDPAVYNVSPHTKLCLGLEYSILRTPFFRPLQKKDDSMPSVYISLGGSDYYGMSVRIVNGFLGRKLFRKIHVLASNSFEQSLMDDLNSIAQKHTELTIHKNMNAEQICDLLDSCTHAFVSASTVLYECYSRGVKCVTGYNIINQKMIYDGFTRSGLALGVGDLHEVDVENIVDAMEASATRQTLSLQKPLESNVNLKKLFHSLC